jgi:hypothetical protein
MPYSVNQKFNSGVGQLNCPAGAVRVLEPNHEMQQETEKTHYFQEIRSAKVAIYPSAS